MKVLFLDHDGVICLYNDWGRRTRSSTNPDEYFDRFDRKAVKILNDIIDKTGCEIVVSSDWRFSCNLEAMGDLYLLRGIRKKPIAYTALEGLVMPEQFKWEKSLEIAQTRSLEILQFLNDNPGIESWVAVDDLDMRRNIEYKTRRESEQREWGLTNFVWTPRANEGIKQVGAKQKILDWLL